MPKSVLREVISSNVIAALREERLRRSLSMTSVAAAAGLHVSHISLVERGQRKPTLDALLRIAEAMGVDLWEVLRRATERAKPGKA